tara:strand:- start:6829 stop:7425 length:597 start_codon:yes stop_codon:yes gene_type:complete
MVVSEKAMKFLGDNLDRGRPIPGQSLTNEPDQPYNWERPSEFTNPKETMLYIFETLTVPETTANILLSLSNGVGVVDIASIVLYSGFLEGKWNPDIMTLMMEPTMFMVVALAEKANIDYVLEAGDDVEPQDISPDKSIENVENRINELEKIRQVSVSRVSPMSVPKEVREKIEEAEIEQGLLDRVKEESQESLLSKKD